MRRPILILLAALAMGSAGCFTGITSNLTAPPPSPGPDAARLNQINSEIASVEQQISDLTAERALAENQRNEAFLELGKLTGMGPKAPSMMDYGSETLTCDPGMLISMHNANMTAAGERMAAIDSQLNGLYNKAATLKAERKKIEQSQAASTKSFFPAEAACFTPDTRVQLPGGVRGIAALAAGEILLAYDEQRGAVVPRPIRQTFRARQDHYFLINDEIRVTAMHRFLTRTGWVRAKDLEVGMELKTADGWTLLAGKKLIEADVEVFNMEVADHHDFFVAGEKTSYLVHNTAGGGGK
jgi:hypothetical protein